MIHHVPPPPGVSDHNLGPPMVLARPPPGYMEPALGQPVVSMEMIRPPMMKPILAGVPPGMMPVMEPLPFQPGLAPQQGPGHPPVIEQGHLIRPPTAGERMMTEQEFYRRQMEMRVKR